MTHLVYSTWYVENSKQKGLKKAIIILSKNIFRAPVCVQPCASCLGNTSPTPTSYPMLLPSSRISQFDGKVYLLGLASNGTQTYGSEVQRWSLEKILEVALSGKDSCQGRNSERVLNDAQDLASGGMEPSKPQP